MTREQRAAEIERLRYRYRVACRDGKRLTMDLIAERLRQLVLRQIKYEIRAEVAS